ncbi:MAG TPA: flagellin [Ilumatobacteraceae bacterium]
MTFARVSLLGASNATMARLRAANGRLDQANEIASSGKAYVKPSDNTAAASRAAYVQNELDQLGTYEGAINDAKGRLNEADTQMSQAMDLYQRITELTTQAANSVSTPDSRAAINQEIQQIKGELVSVANATYLGKPIFGGLNSANAVTYDSSTSTYQFSGATTDALNRRIGPSEVVQTNVTASQIFSNGTNNIFATLDGLSASLTADDTAGIQSALDTVNSLRNTLAGGQAIIGAVSNRVDTATSRNSASKLALTSELSNVQDVDIAQAITSQTQLSTAYQAALAVTAKADQRNLLDWLH